MIRKAPCPFTAYPGNSFPMNKPVACSIVIKRAAAALSALGSRMKRSILLGMRMSAFIGRPSLTRASCNAMVKPRLEMNGNGCAGSMASGVNSGKTWRRKKSSSHAFSFLLTSGPSTRTIPCSERILAQLAPARLLMAREHRDRLADAAELFGRRQPVGALGGDTLAYLAFQAGNPDHEKLVEIVGGNRQETHPFEQRVGNVLGLLEHATIEMEPGQFPIDETIGACRQSRRNSDTSAAAACIVSAASDGTFSSAKTVACARSIILILFLPHYRRR